MVAILDFVFDADERESDKYRYDVKLCDIDTSKVFYDKLKFIYLEMPKFNKKAEELTNHFEKWLYLLKHLSTLDRIPEALQEKIFKKVLEVAEVANLTPEQARSYQDSLKYYRDIKNSIDTAEEKGRLEGIEQGRQEGIFSIARSMLEEQEPVEKIIKFTSLSKEEIESLKN